MDGGNLEIVSKNDEIAKERDAATKAAAKAEAINKFLTVDLLGEAQPDRNTRDKKLTVEELLDRAARRIDSNPDMAKQPEVEAELRDAIGITYHKLGQPKSALPHLERAVALRKSTLGPDHPNTLAAQEALADFMNLSLRRSDLAEPLSYQTWQARRRVLGPEHPDTLDSLDTYATALTHVNKLNEAETRMRECWEARRRTLGETHDQTLTSQNNLSLIVANRGDLAESVRLVRFCYEVRRKRDGLGKTETLSCLNNLGRVLLVQGELTEAERLFREGFETIRKTHGPEHQYTMQHEAMLSRVLLDEGKLGEAESHGRHALTLFRQTMPAGHMDIGWSLFIMGRTLLEKGQASEAQDLLRESAQLFRENYAGRADLQAMTNCWLGAALALLKRYEEAESLLVNNFDEYRRDRSVPARHKEKIRQHLVELYEAWGKPERAAKWRAIGEIK